MSMAYPDGSDSSFTSTPSTPWYEAHPFVALGIGLAGAVAIGYILFHKKTNSTSSATTSTTGDTSGLQTNAQGQGIVYVPTSDLFYNQTTTTGSYNNTSNSNNTSSVDTTTTNTTNPPSSPPRLPLLTIRNQSTADKQKNVQSIPVRETPGGKPFAPLGFGSTIQAIGTLITGPFNYPLSGGSGSNQWYPVQIKGRTGYVSAYDVATASIPEPSSPLSGGPIPSGGALQPL